MGRMTSLLWKTKIHVPNHQPDNKHRNTLAENDFYTILDKRVALRGLRNMLAEYMALKMEKKNVFFAKNCHFDQRIWRFSSTWETVLSTRITWQRQPAGGFFREKPWIWDHVNRVCLCFSHRSAKIFHMAPGMLVLDPRTNFGRKSQFSVDSA